ncbi:MAG: hypothetical protein ACLFN8_02465 [Candidatus Woesearchaeota archaeon]
MSDDFTKKQDFYLWEGPVKDYVQELKELHETQGVAITTIYDANKGTLPQYNLDENNRNILNKMYHHVVGSIIMSNGLDGNDHAQLIVSNIQDSPLVKALVFNINKDTNVNDSYPFSFGSNRDEQNAIFETVHKQLDGTGKAIRISGKDIDILYNNWYANPNFRKDIHLSLNNQDENFFNEFVSYVETKTGRKFSDEAYGAMGIYLNRMTGWHPLVRGSVGRHYANVSSIEDDNYGRLLGGSVGNTIKLRSAEGTTARENTDLEGIMITDKTKIFINDVPYVKTGDLYLPLITDNRL